MVLTNRTSQRITAGVIPDGEKPYPIAIDSGDVLPLFTDKLLRINFVANGRPLSYPLHSNAAYFFGQSPNGRLDLQQIGLGGTPETLLGRSLPGTAATAPKAVITVKLLVDEDQALQRELWEPQMRRRVAKASAILERHSNVRLRVVGVDQWQSDNQTRDFTQSLKEFERKVDPGPARLAIGFTSQYEAPLGRARGRTHLGGIRGPLRSHLMVREWSQFVTEPEKLELLVHELGHFLAATHSPEPDSVMRPILGDRKSRLTNFEIRFDVVNTLLMSMVGEEMRRRGVNQFRELSPGTRSRLTQIYTALEKGIPGDQAASQFRQLLAVKTPASTLPGQTRQVLHAIVATAQKNRKLPKIDRLTGDLLTEAYVKAAAAEAARLPPELGRKAFLLALAIGVGDARALLQGSQSPAVRSVASDAHWRASRGQIGWPTVAKRRDLAKHFTVSAGLTAVLDAEQADLLGYAKEAFDSQGGSGFSFVDLAANRAGIRFAEKVLAGKFPLRTLAEHFLVANYMPSINGLPERLTNAEVARQFGGKGDPQFEAQMARIESRIDALPPYSPLILEL